MLRRTLVATTVALAAAEIADLEWVMFKATHQKAYNDLQEEHSRYEIFLESKARVERLNKLNGHPAFGINWMSDRRPEEKHKKGLKKRKDFVPRAPVVQAMQRRWPANIDWRLGGAVTTIKNQGECASCWAFSATEAIESQLALTTGGKYRLDLSPQQIASCDPISEGCGGGEVEDAYDYVSSAPGLANSFFIPYEQSLTEEGPTMACPTAKVEAIVGEMEYFQGGYAEVSGYAYAVTPCNSGPCENQDLDAFAAALERTPMSVCVNTDNWHDYTGGVVTSAACGSMAGGDQDHAAMAVGFNTTAELPYWIVRNSWSDQWGDYGYIYLEMAKNTCGVADFATIPQVSVPMSDEEAAEAANLREDMYRRATGAFAAESAIVV